MVVANRRSALRGVLQQPRFDLIRRAHLNWLL